MLTKDSADLKAIIIFPRMCYMYVCYGRKTRIFNLHSLVLCLELLQKQQPRVKITV